MLIDFSDIPGMTRLFLDFMYDFRKVENYYNINFREEESYNDLFQKICERENPNKTEIVKIIKNQYKSLKVSSKTEQNIELLNDDKTVAIFTGQQLGLMGGPLYTIYKIFTAIKLSEHLSSRFKEFNFIPVFWMAGDDHDFEEISNINLVSTDNEIKKIIYDDGNELNTNRGSVGDVEFLKSINDFKSEISNYIRETEFSDNLISLINNVLEEGLTIKQSFFNLLYQIFDDAGLIIFNPQDNDVKKLLVPIFKKELIDYKKHTADLLLISAELDENYHAQVKIKPINLFMADETGRHLIEPVEDGYRLKGKRKRISRDELLQILENEPERFSGNVLLRPICEDYLFPTGFYIGGPGEISYYAQAIPLYKHYGLQHPIVFPRASATIVEGNIAKILVKYNLSTLDFFNDNQKLKDMIVNSLSDIDVEKNFATVEKTISDILNSLGETVTSIDNNLKNANENTKSKMLHQLDILKNKTAKSQERNFDAAIRQISKAQNLIYPNENLQERELCMINFVNKYGFDFFDWLYNELEIMEFKHQVMEI